MKNLWVSAEGCAWVLLLAATAISLWVGADHSVALGGPAIASVAVLVVAFVKVAVIGMFFMELRHAPVEMRQVFAGTLIVSCSALVAIYLLT
jgi:heme/copper-type cytochrome/quinol oxidase subunit 4